MSRLFRDSRRDSSQSSSSLSNGFAAAVSLSGGGGAALPSPFPDLGVPLAAGDLRDTAYEVLVAASRTTGGKPLTYIPQSQSASLSPSPSLSPSTSSSSPSLQRSLTSAAASKMKKALGLKASKGGGGVGGTSPGSGGKGGAAAAKRPATVGELMRVQMQVSERADARIRRGLLRIAASQESNDPIESGQSVPPPSVSVAKQRKSRKRTSEVWNYFLIVVENSANIAVCNYCHHKFSCKSIGGTGHLSRHTATCAPKHSGSSGASQSQLGTVGGVLGNWRYDQKNKKYFG